ncbi:Kynureninase {ECO:0000255/HAMAP-Rule:MF_03017} {ECO:0000255/HAMAP-Rule:MF_03017}; AltName: Full=Biosynthesis of nicotinic acid protein 5 {ECO:0000255/HAMAP-Rule:MF_03017}; AltName: Full=L-kynurenine hydrolase {ECO:0000255/HAMAP-Rule:MF_03017} [Serendipita indica DSM 11827]|nr:Kynureninase {ECO:0000255/HAMAP-Rule:MF_03017} {ECO:0000255/HAMAP-Rule:MF_03017}; AltName: Full=Biosynthesis of nicotinic acid protein 5 {ECO:0000255/HAMAP-Rule:MF_03017}; AltName: Full=L-kynurenine hydrolase {ECO:0000255/HAMAP-Rule:MF_03017} [Serendipita indica DSM 11827]
MRTGADPVEVACMGTLTANLHLMMNSFYKPTKDRYKIICEARAFPSDQYAFASQAQSHGFEPKSAIIEVWPRSGEFTLRESDILDTIRQHGKETALVLFSGVQYYTGQWFPMRKITEAGHDMASPPPIDRTFPGALVGWDLAHAIGNVPLRLHDWGVDFAVWCSYKYLNAGPGSIGGLFVHQKWHDKLPPSQAGWWGHDPRTRFQMPSTFSPIKGAQGFQQSNPGVLSTVSLLGSLEVFQAAGGLDALRKQSVALTKTLEDGIRSSKHYIPVERAHGATKPCMTIITPAEIESRGAQLSVLFLPSRSGTMQKIQEHLKAYGVVGDERNPDVIRLAPAPLYVSEEDCERAIQVLNDAFESLAME